MLSIIYPDQLKRATVFIENINSIASKSGTGFLVQDDIILTAYHVVESAEILNISFINLSGGIHHSKATIISYQEDSDVALLKLESKPDELIEPLPISRAPLRLNDRWETYGFPAQHQLTGRPYRGHILQFNEQARWRATLEVENIGPDEDLEGLSGAPLITNNLVNGIIRVQNGRDIGISIIEQFADWLELNNVPIQPATENYKINLTDIEPNDIVLDQLSHILTTNRHSWYLLTGSPGSGKTTLVATWQPNDDEPLINCGQYYLKQSDDTIPISVRASKETLLLWLNDVISSILYGQKAPAPDTEKSFEQRIAMLASGLGHLSQFFIQQGKTGVIFIDGFDNSLPMTTWQDFLSILPGRLGEGICFVLSATGRKIIPISIQSQIEASHEIVVTPLNIENCTSFVLKQISTLTYNQAQLLAEKSEGHPLYLRYLIRTVQIRSDHEGLDAWLNQIPMIGGEIKQYYAQLWPQIKEENNRLQIALTVAALRQPISRAVLYEMLSVEVQPAFPKEFPMLIHLFKSEDQISLYHASFGEYLLEMAPERMPQTHGLIAAYSIKNYDDSYSIANLVFHLNNSEDSTQGIIYCNQTWADRCTFNHVEPDLILSDIRSTKSLCIKYGQVIDLLRLQLLHHRMVFRYNQVFSFYATYMADTLLAMNQPEAALRYILRGGVLQVGEQDALIFIQRFFLMGAFNPGKALLSFVKSQGKRKLIEALYKGDLEVNDFFLFFAGITLSAYLDFKDAQNQFAEAGMMVFEKWQPMIAETDEDKQFFDHVKITTLAYRLGFLLWNKGAYVPVSTLKEQKIEFKLRDTTLWFSLIHLFKLFNETASTDPNSEMLEKVAEDAFYLLENYGYQAENLENILNTSLELCKKTATVLPLCNAYLRQGSKLTIRGENGVDVNHSHISKMILRANCQGYLCTIGEDYPRISKPTPHTWQQQIENCISYLGHLQGQLYRLQAENRHQDIIAQLNHYHKLEKDIRFSLLERSQWDRSYGLPEAVLPHLYQLLAQICVKFFPSEVDGWIDRLLNHTFDQLGLYSEGFRECLLNVADVLRRKQIYRKSAFKVLNCIEDHIVKGVQNRWERTPALMRIAELYALNGNRERSQRVFSAMIDTSMGPAWYKEDQFNLATTVIEHCVPTLTTEVLHLLGIVDAASSEMTFQRYIRQDKNALPKSMAKRGWLIPALNFYKTEILPNTETVIKNAESLLIDQIRIGDGYILGARNLTEASAISSLLKVLPSLHPRLQWAYCEIFSHNDDTWRYASDYGQLQGESFNRLIEMPGELWQDVLPDWLRSIHAGNFSDNELREYLPAFSKALSNKAYTIIANNLRYHVKLFTLIERKATSVENDEQLTSLEEFSGFPGTGRQSTYNQIKNILNQVKEEDQMENYKLAGQILNTYIKELSREGWDIWAAGSYSKEMGDLIAEVVKHSSTGAELMIALEEPIINNSEWRVAKRLIQWITPKLSPTDAEKIAMVVIEHLSMLTRPSDEQLNKYSEIVENDVENVDTVMIHFLVWHLQHPSDSWRLRTKNEIVTLAKAFPELVIEVLLETTVGPFMGSLNEQTATILPQLSTSYPKQFWEVLSNRPDLVLAFEKHRHFLIRNNMLEVLSILHRNISAVDELKDRFEKAIPKVVILTNEVILEEIFLRPIQGELNALNEMKLLNGSFCEELLARVKELCNPLSIESHLKADRYIKRSFEKADFYISPFHARLRFALNCAITQRVDRRTWDDVVAILEN